jgi:D-arginine dehydrogenase
MKNQIENLSLINAQKINELIPIVNTEMFPIGIYEQNAKDMDANEIHQSYIRGLTKKGGEVQVQCCVTGIQQADGIWKVQTTNGDYYARIIINAAGAWGDEIARLAHVRPVGVEAKKRTVIFIDIEKYDISNWPYVGDLTETFYFKPDAGKLFVSPCDEIPVSPCDAKPNDLDIALAINTLELSTEVNVKTVSSSMAGLRSFVSDRTPVVGYDSEVSNFFWLVGQGGYGFQTAPAMAQCCKALIEGKNLPADLKKLGVVKEALSPERITLER